VVGENEFFRKATLRICGSLEIEEGLRSCFQYISQHLPADRIYLERNEPDLASMRIVVRADATGGERMDQLIPYTEEARAAMVEAAELWRKGAFPPVFLVGRSEEEPVTQCILSALGEPPSSAMSLPLVVGGRLVGALAIIAEGDDRYTEDHARLYATLREPFSVAMSNALEHQEVVRLKDRLADNNLYLNRELLRLSGDEIVGVDFGLRDVMRQVRQVAPTESPVLLQGETGVGKDVIANAIHLGSPRRDGPFIPVNCGAIPETLLDSELFGHEKGAFTGAHRQKEGRFRQAHSGSLFLDEISEMSLAMQVKLLRVLQEREITRVGGEDVIPVDVRIIAATNRDLIDEIREGRFREDLYYRLNVVSLRMPPLRERREDIPLLAQHFLERFAEANRKDIRGFAPRAMDRLLRHPWPGNVRELMNAVERAVVLSRAEILTEEDLPAVGDGNGSREEEADGSPHAPRSLEEVEKAAILETLKETGGNKSEAARRLGITRKTLHKKLKAYESES